MSLEIQIGKAWHRIKRTYSRSEAISLVRASSVPARVIGPLGNVIAARIFP